ncbi:MAG TPA: ABC transporter permease [Candidatus Acidoferrum sp.]|nr:ABC transporter permease [Candidatus Acidoferrum sp.]
MGPNHWIYTVPLRLRSLFRRHQVEKDLSEELRFHVEQKTQEYVAAGLPLEEARRKTRREFGGVEQAKENCRDTRRVNFLETLLQDIRIGSRMLRKSPGFASIAVLTLALGIGANTAIFSVVHAVLLDGLSYPDAKRLVLLNEVRLRTGPISVSWPNYLDWRAQSRSFADLAAYQLLQYDLTGIGEPEVLHAAQVSSSFFALLGAQPLLGRAFVRSEDKAGTNSVVILSYSLWRNRFGGDPEVIGRALTLSGAPFTVVGVLPAEFEYFPQHVDLYTAIGLSAADPRWAKREQHPGIVVLARLRNGVSLSDARMEMKAISERLAAEYPEANTTQRASVTPLSEERFGSVQGTLLAVLAAAGFVLLLACANVANLFLARGSARKREMAVRSALGAGRLRIARQFLTESMLVAGLGGCLGILVAFGALQPLLRIAPADIPRLNESRIDLSVLAFAIGISVLCAALFGIAPAVQESKIDLIARLKERAAASGDSARHRVLSGLFVLEVALALVLVSASSLLLRSLIRAQDVNPGFNPRNILALDVLLPVSRYKTREHQLQFFTQALSRLRALPGVRSTSAAFCPPIVGICWGAVFTIAGQPIPPREQMPGSMFNAVFPGYFESMEIPLIRGRTFMEADTATSARVAVINRTLAQRWWPNKNPVGQVIQQGFPEQGGPQLEIVGVVGDIKQFGPDKEQWPEVFLPSQQSPFQAMTLLLRTEKDPMLSSGAAKEIIQSLDKDLPVSRIQPMTRFIADELSRRTFAATLFAIFGGLAVLLAAIGIYGVMAFRVAQRSHEIGIRIALGAQRRDIRNLIFGQGISLTLVGIALGLGGALALTRFISSLLFQVSPTDLATLTGVPVVLLAVAVAGCHPPMRRALKVDPIATLRDD